MSCLLPSPLPRFDRRLLLVVERIVPPAERKEWLRTWQAELWHMHHASHGRHARISTMTADLSIGLTRDALWLRTESWRRTFNGTPILCLATLLSLCWLSALIALVAAGSWHSLGLFLGDQLKRCLIAAPLVVFVTFATASRRHIENGSINRRRYWIKRQLFFTAKMSLVLSLAFLLSADICRPVHAFLPITADLLQILCFVIIALVGLRWTFIDQEQRCKQCIHMLATPARVGRPSHNLLEWNGTELLCKQGHGLLSIPEMETSWCQSSHWVNQMSNQQGVILYNQ
jgi:hypothetical protein